MGTNFNYDDTSHQVIFDHINGGSGSQSLQAASQAWRRLGDDVGLTGKSYVHSAISGILMSREGAAAAAAAAATAAMLPWLDDVALVATRTAQRAQDQADHWVTAKNSVPPVPPAPESAGFFGDPGESFTAKMDWISGLTSDEEQAHQHRQDAAEQARQAMRVYQASSNGNIDPDPAFTAPRALDASIGALQLVGLHVSDSTGTSGFSGSSETAASAGASAQQAPLPAAYQPADSQPAATVSQLAQGGPALPGTTFAAPWASNPSTPTSVQTATAGLPPISAGRGDGTAYGSRPSSAFGPRPTVSAAQQPGEELGGSRGVGSAGATGTGRGSSAAGYEVPFAGGHVQRGDQDQEHRGRYLVHEDSNAIIGALPPTAPPVIGEDPG
jgi:PPE family